MDLSGAVGDFAVHRWTPERARLVVLLAQTDGRTTGRDGWLASCLVAAGAAVLAPDHIRARRGDEPSPAAGDEGTDAVEDLRLVVGYGHGKHPGLPLVVLGESTGARLATRFALAHPEEISALVLVSPAYGDGIAQGEGDLGDLPTLWLHSDGDAAAPRGAARDVLAGIRGSRVVERGFPGTTHELFRGEERDAALAELLGFLGALSAPLDAAERAAAAA